MQEKDLQPAGLLARDYGVKSLIYGPPGSAKTPLVNSCPRPVLLVCEPGMLSMKGSTVPAYEAFTPAAIDDFMAWLKSSAETRKFDTVAVDSISQMCDIYLQVELSGRSNSGNKQHGQQAYGKMASKVMEHIRTLYYMQYKHTYLICKEMNEDGMKRPYFPGKQLNSEIPHLFDAILRLATHNIPGNPQSPCRAFLCAQTTDELARDRSGKLAQYEYPDFGMLVKKVMN